MNYEKPLLGKEKADRINLLREKSLGVTQEVCVERARYLTEEYRSNKSDHMITLRAKALKNILEKMSIFIDSGELLVGNQAGGVRAAPIFPEYTVDWIIDEIDELPKRTGDRYGSNPRCSRGVAGNLCVVEGTDAA